MSLASVPELKTSKCIKHIFGKKSTIGDKPAVRRNKASVILDLDRMPCVRGVATTEDFGQQQAAVSLLRAIIADLLQFLLLLQEDGALGALGDIDM